MGLEAAREELNQREEVVKEAKRELQEAEVTLEAMVASKRDAQTLSTAHDEVKRARDGLESAQVLVNALRRHYARSLEASSAAGACVCVRAR